ncbi:MAG: serine protease [Euryarchaeota archaeon]|nr:serine protease [Euryarchaeota archaeon]
MSLRPPRHKVFAAVLLVFLVSLSGCMSQADGIDGENGSEDVEDGDDGNEDSGLTPDEPDANTTDDAPTDGNTTIDPDNGTTGDPGNDTSPPDNGTTNTTRPAWVPIGDAVVRPGVRHVTGSGQCTTNFLYWNKVNETLYIGTAAHCVDGAKGDESTTVYGHDERPAFKTRVAYSSWDAIGFVPKGDNDAHPHDFALLEVPREHWGLVHPATLHYGGPTALADMDALRAGQRVIVYGNSGLRLGIEETNREEGVLRGVYDAKHDDHPDKWRLVSAQIAPLGVPGDSGSGLMTKDGKAIGAASTLSIGYNVFDPVTTSGAWLAYSPIPDAVGHLNADGWDLELVTWDLISSGRLP